MGIPEWKGPPGRYTRRQEAGIKNELKINIVGVCGLD